GAINVGHTGYANYPMAGIFVQTVAITSLGAGTGVAQDLHSGLIDRFRSLPIARSAVITARVVATLVRNLFTLGIVAAVGVGVGLRAEGGPAGWGAGLGLLRLAGVPVPRARGAVGLLVRHPAGVRGGTAPRCVPL